MEHITKKTKLGIAIQEAIKELNLEREQTKIMQIFHKAFMDKYEDFKAHSHSNTITLKGSYIVDNEFPIGDQDRQQYFRAITYRVRMGNHSISSHSEEEKRPFTLIEGYSKNEDAKKRSHPKMGDRKDLEREKEKALERAKKKRKTN